MMTMRTVALTKESTKDILENLLKRSPNNYGKFEAAVDNILKNVKEKGDEALFAYTKEFDKTEITGETIRVTEEEIKEAYEAVDPGSDRGDPKSTGEHQKLSRETETEQLVYYRSKGNHAWSEGDTT